MSKARNLAKVMPQSSGKAALNNAAALTFNSRTISSDLTIGAGENALSVGPIRIADGVNVVIEDGGEWGIV